MHCDWLCAEGSDPADAIGSGHIIASEYRIELMREHRELEQTMSDLASLEGGANAAASGSRARPSPRADTPSAGRGP